MPAIPMVDLKGQYLKIKREIDEAISGVVMSTQFIKGPQVASFEQALGKYLGANHVIACGNGTDALQIALMSLGLEPGDEVIVPAFTYVATAEVIGLLKLTPVMVDVDPHTFNVTAELVEAAVTSKTKAIVPVHLFGQSTDMEAIMALAEKHNLYVIEDNAQAIGADYTFSTGEKRKTGTIGHIGCTSFFPSKNLGCYGDGGAIFTNDDELGAKIRMIANHGQNKKYYHKYIGVNSRLDALQAAVLNIKLKYLDDYSKARRKVADYYDKNFEDIAGLSLPVRQHNSTHVFHQYTMVVKDGKRDALKEFLAEKDISSMVYYPVPLHKQEAFHKYNTNNKNFPVTEKLCNSVLSLPIHTEMKEETMAYITEQVHVFFKT